ncbi:hypothetical protein [Paraburkholderia bonniea]|uniref:hypothetical protein n=1 Tax=Paraburkholderia bonniea TaxID=2152891 RepID=UPI0012927666|nr:hypothetical protein [Paraburkholderia bonniea]
MNLWKENGAKPATITAFPGRRYGFDAASIRLPEGALKASGAGVLRVTGSAARKDVHAGSCNGAATVSQWPRAAAQWNETVANVPN